MDPIPRPHRRQFLVLTGVNLLVGAMVGHERAILPLLATDEFGLGLGAAASTFVIAFGAVKAISNVAAGRLADRFGRRPVLLAGWIAMVPVPIVLATTDSWTWVVVANALLGAGQGLAWTATVVMQMDLAGPTRRGLAAGINEAAGYGGVSLAALGTGMLAGTFGLRPVPFLAAACLGALGLGLASVAGEPPTHTRSPGASLDRGPAGAGPRAWTVALAQAGAVNNLNDAVAWGLFPLLWRAEGVSIPTIAVLAAIYPGVWGLGQLATGALSDRLGRRRLIVAGMLTQAAGLAAIAAASDALTWGVGAAALGVGTALAYPVLLAAVGDAASAERRASALGNYRFWRDAGFVVGGSLVGVLAEPLGLRETVAVTASLTLASGIAVAGVRSTGSRSAAHSGRPSSSRRATKPRRRNRSTATWE
jgi:MFS family permease